MKEGHLTTRPSFIFGLAFVVLLLIPLWSIYGVFETREENHAGHGSAMGMDNAKQTFVEETLAFIAKNTRPDGCTVPATPEERAEKKQHTAEGEHGSEEDHTTEPAGAPVVYLQAFQWGYRPSKICLQSGKTYEFRMMATDVIHGASIQLGPGSKMVRLPPGVEVEQKVTFTEPGEYLLYCSYYCGVGHQFMMGRIIVEPDGEEAK